MTPTFRTTAPCIFNIKYPVLVNTCTTREQVHSYNVNVIFKFFFSLVQISRGKRWKTLVRETLYCLLEVIHSLRITDGKYVLKC